MKKDMICPACGELGFSRAEVYSDDSTMKCEKCGEWNANHAWEQLKTWKGYRAEVATLTSANLDLTERVLYAERERDEARAAFKKYGWHVGDCSRRMRVFQHKCKCGFDDIAKAAREAK